MKTQRSVKHDRSAYGLPDETGVLVLDVPGDSAAARAGLQKDDVMVGCNGKPVRTIKELQALKDKAAGGTATISVYRKQKQFAVELADIDGIGRRSDA